MSVRVRSALTAQKVVRMLARLQVHSPGGVPLRELVATLAQRYRLPNDAPERLKAEARKMLRLPVAFGFVTKAGSWYRVTRAPRQLARRGSRMWRSLSAAMRQHEAQQKALLPPPPPPQYYADPSAYPTAWPCEGTLLHTAPTVVDASVQSPSSPPSTDAMQSSHPPPPRTATGHKGRRPARPKGHRLPCEVTASAVARLRKVKLERVTEPLATKSSNRKVSNAWTAIIRTRSGQKMVNIVPPETTSTSTAKKKSRSTVKNVKSHTSSRTPLTLQSRLTTQPNNERRSAGRRRGSSKSTSKEAPSPPRRRRCPRPRASLSSFGRRSLSLSSSSDRPRVYKPTRQDVINSHKRRLHARLLQARREHAKQEALRRRELERRLAERRRLGDAPSRVMRTASPSATHASRCPVAHPAATRRTTPSHAANNGVRERSQPRRRPDAPPTPKADAKAQRPTSMRPWRAAVEQCGRGVVRGRCVGGRSASDLERLLPPCALGLMRELSYVRVARAPAPRPLHVALIPHTDRAHARNEKGQGDQRNDDQTTVVVAQQADAPARPRRRQRPLLKQRREPPCANGPTRQAPLAKTAHSEGNAPPNKAGKALDPKTDEAKPAEASACNAPPDNGEAEKEGPARVQEAKRSIYVGKPLPRHRAYTLRSKQEHGENQLTNGPNGRSAQTLDALHEDPSETTCNSPPATNKPHLAKEPEDNTKSTVNQSESRNARPIVTRQSIPKNESPPKDTLPPLSTVDASNRSQNNQKNDAGDTNIKSGDSPIPEQSGRTPGVEDQSKSLQIKTSTEPTWQRSAEVNDGSPGTNQSLSLPHQSRYSTDDAAELVDGIATAEKTLVDAKQASSPSLDEKMAGTLWQPTASTTTSTVPSQSTVVPPEPTASTTMTSIKTCESSVIEIRPKRSNVSSRGHSAAATAVVAAAAAAAASKATAQAIAEVAAQAAQKAAAAAAELDLEEAETEDAEAQTEPLTETSEASMLTSTATQMSEDSCTSKRGWRPPRRPKHKWPLPRAKAAAATPPPQKENKTASGRRRFTFSRGPQQRCNSPQASSPGAQGESLPVSQFATPTSPYKSKPSPSTIVPTAATSQPAPPKSLTSSPSANPSGSSPRRGLLGWWTWRQSTAAPADDALTVPHKATPLGAAQPSTQATKKSFLDLPNHKMFGNGQLPAVPLLAWEGGGEHLVAPAAVHPTATMHNGAPPRRSVQGTTALQTERCKEQLATPSQPSSHLLRTATSQHTPSARAAKRPHLPSSKPT